MRKPPSAPSAVRRLLTAGLAVTLLSLGLASPASASTTSNTAATGKAAATSPKHNVEALCGKAKKGFSSCFSLRRTDLVQRQGVQPNVTPNGFGPADLVSAYAIPANGGAGQTVAIVDAFDDPNAEADLAVYRSQYGLPACTTANGCFRKVDQRGGTAYPVPNADWAGEISLDIDMVSAIAPAAHILLVESDDNGNDNLGAAVDEAVALGALFVSNSYGSGYTSTPGSGEDPSEVTDFDPFYNHPGVAVVASSGDDDFGVSYPAASQYVTSVGGTSLVTDSSARGWSESVWSNSFGGPGSGCSLFEAKPSWQTDSGCANRTVSDVSAVADPETGVAVYDSFQASGWGVFGGTSVSSPIIASTFAVAGTPVAGTYPSSYPYAATGSLNDVTTGSNGMCTPAYYCTAEVGYDGPTGLGTPHGVAAFTTGPHGVVSGTVTDSGTSAPIAGADVSAGDAHSTTDASGHYSLSVPVGTYTVTAAAYGYATATVSGVVVTDGGTITENFALVSVPKVTLTGTVLDASGHGWPLYATITADGVPGGPVFTDPYTGQYSITLPASASYSLHVSANYPGYLAVTQPVTLGTTDLNQNIGVPVDTASCFAPGYAVGVQGITQTFDSGTTPAGWTVTNNTPAGGWVFNDPKPRGNLTGGTGGFAIIDSDFLGIGNTEDTYLISPSADLTAVTSPDVGFDSDYRNLSSTADVDVSVDGGTTWTNVWERSGVDERGPSHVDVPLPMAAGKANVQVRFHYTGTWAWWWEVDNVFVGARTCNPVHGGLVAGVVTDKNTHAGVIGATVTSVDKPTENATTAATPADPNLGDGFYWMFSSLTGNHKFTAAKNHYVAQTKTVNVHTNGTTKASFNLAAGRITVTPTSINKTVQWGASATQNVVIKNTGGAPVTVQLGEQPGGSTMLTANGAPLNRVAGSYSPHSLHAANGTVKKPSVVAPRSVTPSAAPWTAIADYPITIQDNSATVLDGKVYSGFGFAGAADSSALYVYDPDSGSWTALAHAADTREKPAFAGIDGKLYAAGGWGASGSPDSKVEIYDPASNSWTTGMDNPKPYAGSAYAVLGGKLYIVGGCATSTCGTADVMVYDPAGNSWSQVASYPEAVSWESCGAIAGKLYCSGGTTDAGSVLSTNVYDPGSDSWSPLADLPTDLWGGGYTAAEGQLLISGGVTANNATVTNAGYAFDPSTGSWSPLPNSNNTTYRGASACGFYKIGGSPGGQSLPLASSEVLPGMVDCGETADVSWLSESPTTLTLAAGASATVVVTLNSAVPDITQPGTYTAKITVGTDTPYSVPAIGVSMTVNPPKSWGKITGTVTGPSGVIPGATVQITSWATHYTLKTDKFGVYALWLDVRNNPLQLIVAKDGFQPQVKTIKIVKGTTTTLNFALLKS